MTRGPHALTFPSGGAGDVARCAVDPTRAGAGFGSPKGFAGVGLSDNAGSDWADATFGEHAVAVNFAEPSATSRALRGGGGPPAGLPVHLSGANFGGSRRAEADGGNRPPLACAFDGRAAPTALDENGGVSAALHRCETPPARRRHLRRGERRLFYLPAPFYQPATVPAERSRRARGLDGHTVDARRRGDGQQTGAPV